ncbi:MAG: hypothetical protein M3442_07630, partial [Chloroflexota bacterium]|nr:hypothetical protein [Chloroflexota bacterium]
MKPISRLMLTLAACSTLLLGVAAPVTAQTLPAERVPGLDTPVQSLTQDDLKKIAELVAGERIPVARAAELWDRMNEQQQTAVVEAIVVREGIPL